ncbi:MAG: FliA/WhiG family RNA polymerase sigma factor [Tissierellia bacterium]|nr:FliA/WhiG family RNA polymerase sigma factor [Tissierellia bacterium]
MKLEKLWNRYAQTDDRDIRQQLIEEYIDLVKIIAGRMYNFYGGKIEYEDLLGFGIMGLIDSIKRFDLDKNTKFETYAQIRIRGTIIDNIRKLDWIPRSLRRRSKEIEEAMGILENQLGRAPYNDELSKFLNISLDELESTLASMVNFNIVSLENLLHSKGEYNIDSEQNPITPEKALEKKELKESLAEAIDMLNPQEKTIISLYYYEELTYKEIGYIIDLSESRISQIHSKSILKIKNRLTKSLYGA